MKRRIILLPVLALVLTVTLSACSDKTTLRFSNETECGTASISLTNMESGNIKDYTVNQGKEIEIEVDAGVEYRYEVEYPRQPDFMQCDSKRVTTMVSEGQTLTIRLTSILDPELVQTQTAAPIQTQTAD